MICFELILTDDNEIDWGDLPLSLDVDDETQPIIELEDPDLWKGSYTGEVIYNVAFPNTDKNQVILGGMLSGSSYQLKRKEYNIVAIYNGEIMNVDRMYAVRNGFNNDGRFDVQLYNSNNWVKRASEKKINTINLVGHVSHSRGNMELYNSFGPKWEDNGFPIRYPFVLRGNNEIKAATPLYSYLTPDPKVIHFFTESDFTPYVSLLAVLRKGFLEIGWKFECPFLESDYGRRIWVDLVKDEMPQIYGREPFLLEGGFAYYGTKANSRFRLFGNKDTDYEKSTTPNINNQWFNDGVFNEAVIADFNLSMTIKRISPTKEVFQGWVYVHVMINVISVGIYPYYLSGGKYEYVNIDLPEISVNERDSLSVEVALIREGSYGTNTPIHYLQFTDIKFTETKLHRRFLQRGAIYKVNEMFQEDSLIDLLKGVSTMIYGKIDKDYNNRIIRLLAPYDTVLGGETIVGYHKSETQELGNIQRVDINQNDITRKRYLQLKFKDTEEKLIKDLYPNNDKAIKQFSLHGLFIDFGEQYEKSVDTIENQYFVPTFSPTNGTVFFNAVAGYEDGTYINKGRRIVFALGNVDFQPSGKPVIKPRFWSSSGSFSNPFWAHQSYNEEYFVTPSAPFMHLSFSTIKRYINYQDIYPNLYDTFIKQYVLNLITSVTGTVWRYISAIEFSRFDKRKQYFFSIKDKNIVCDIIDIDGYRPCDNQSMAMKFIIGDNFRKEPIYTSTPPEFDRPFDENFDFEIEIEKLDCVYYILNAGTNVAQYQYIDETEWYDYTEDGIDARATFTIRLIDEIGDSDLGDSDLNIVATRIVQVCSDEYSAYIEFEVVDDGTVRKYKPKVEGIPDLDIDFIEWTINEDDAGDSDVVFGDELIETESDLVCASAVVHFICSCDPMVLPQVCYRFNGSEFTCDELGLEMELEDGCWKPVRTGTAACCVQLDLILWKIKEEDVWSVLREPIETICGNTVWFKRVVTFTNGCENIAIEINSDES